jgi:hypothetical protein
MGALVGVYPVVSPKTPKELRWSSSVAERVKVLVELGHLTGRWRLRALGGSGSVKFGGDGGHEQARWATMAER